MTRLFLCTTLASAVLAPTIWFFGDHSTPNPFTIFILLACILPQFFILVGYLIEPLGDLFGFGGDSE